MTEQERDMVTELLRCTVDRCLSHRWIRYVADDMDVSAAIVAFAESAVAAADADVPIDRYGSHPAMLEAALRVEQGEWP